tara:strand:+ start:174 stop:353 length:180 start_codon:yes stop_codon:yes gene_type:complete
MNLTNFLLFLILVTLATYTFMPWKGINKGSKLSIFLQFIFWTVVFTLLLYLLTSFGLII